VRKALLLFYLRRILRLKTPARIINFSFKRYRDKVFLIEPGSGLKLTFRDFQENTQQIALYLRKIGVAKGDTVVFHAPNCAEYFAIRAACHCLDIIFLGLPLNLPQETIVYFLQKSNAKIIFYRGQKNLNVAEIKGMVSTQYYIDLDKGLPKFEIGRHLCNLRRSSANQPGAVSTYNLSSGTTQKIPKIIQLSNENWVESLYGYIKNSLMRSANFS